MFDAQTGSGAPAGWNGDISIAVTRDALCPKGRATVTLGMVDGSNRTHRIDPMLIGALIMTAMHCIVTSDLKRVVDTIAGVRK